MPTKATLTQVLEFIREADLTDRQTIQRELNYRSQVAIADAKEEFQIGDRVEFDCRKRGYAGVIRGKLVEKRVKNFIVQPDDGGQRWKVTASMVRKSF